MDSDAQLVERTLRGDRNAFAQLVQRYERVGQATARRIVGDLHRADDVVQESFIAAFKSLTNLRASSKFGPWLLSIVRRQAIRSLRRHRETVVLNGSTDDTEYSVGSEMRPEDSMALLEIVDRLPDDERTLIGLRHFQGHSMKEIATITSRPVGTVTKQLSRIHKKLRSWLSEEETQ